MWVYETYVPYDDLRAAVAARFVSRIGERCLADFIRWENIHKCF